MVVWHHQLNGHEFEQALGVGAGEGGLACCSLLGLKESDMTKRLNRTELLLLLLLQTSTENVKFLLYKTLLSPVTMQKCLDDKHEM